jgi:hypothetical protein
VCYQIYGNSVKVMEDHRVCFGAPTDEESCRACVAEPEPEPEVPCEDTGSGSFCGKASDKNCKKANYIEKCAASCGLCEAAGAPCEDTGSANFCGKASENNCKKDNYIEKCAASCGLCEGGMDPEPEPEPEVPGCEDTGSGSFCGKASESNCQKSGYIQKCAASCGLCEGGMERRLKAVSEAVLPNVFV